jgi:hypothetical protein
MIVPPNSTHFDTPPAPKIIDFNNTFFSRSAGGWSFFCHMDKEDGKSGANSPAVTGGVSAARELFKNKTARGQDLKTDTDTLKTLHERAITLIQDASLDRKVGGGGVSRISTSSLDGKLIVWDLPSLELDMATLGI